MTYLDKLTDYLKYNNVRAMLKTIAHFEAGYPTYDAYKVLLKHQKFISFDRLYFPNAFGAYQVVNQIKSPTHKESSARTGLPLSDFNPFHQDLTAVDLIYSKNKSMKYLMSGDLDSFYNKSSWEWASMLPNRYGQSKVKRSNWDATYQKYGGTFHQAVKVVDTIDFPVLYDSTKTSANNQEQTPIKTLNSKKKNSIIAVTLILCLVAYLNRYKLAKLYS
jgi:muramidase (phage lysozyme)